MTALDDHPFTAPPGPDSATQQVCAPAERTFGTAPREAAVCDPAEVEEFLQLFYAEHPKAGPLHSRLAQVCAEIAVSGTYRHTPVELAFGARVAWRNAARCIG
ncbi:MAG: nitric oxide synthase oxygenase, partial [Actinomycetes bacterium]